MTVADLQGGKAKLVVPSAGPASDRQRAQQANDRGLQLYREKQYDEAVAQFTEALKLRPDFAQAPTTSASSTTASSAMPKRRAGWRTR